MKYSDEFMRRINTRGPTHGSCNICGVHSKLTEDHVPPKGVPGCGEFNLYGLQAALDIERGQGRRFPNGVKYRTLCKRCNYDLLGGQYDPALVALAVGIQSELQKIAASGREAARSVWVRTQPARVLRSLVGHVLAIGSGGEFVDSKVRRA